MKRGQTLIMVWNAHVVELAVHRGRIGPLDGIHVDLAHLGPIEPVDHQHVEREMPIAVALGDRQDLILRAVTLLALDKPVGGFRKHRRGPGKLPVAGVDLVGGVAGDHEERYPVAHLGGPAGLLVEAGLDDRLGGIVPDHAVTVVGDQKRHAHAGGGGGGVVVPAFDSAAAVVEKPLLVLAQAVVVLVVGRNEGRADLVKGRVRRALVIHHAGVAVLVIGHGHRPARHLREPLAAGSADGNVSGRSGPVEELRDVQFRRHGLARAVGRHGDHQALRPVDVALGILLPAPALWRTGWPQIHSPERPWPAP